MLQVERYERILNELNMRSAVKVTELAEALAVSESTIRRDIAELAKDGRLRKVFGGAVKISLSVINTEYDMETKSEMMVEEKSRIAAYAAGLVADGDFVFIDAGSTTFKMIDQLSSKKAVYVTNGLSHGMRLASRGMNVYIVGGQIKQTTEAIVGVSAVEMIRGYNFNKCFIGANGIDIDKGFTTPDIDESMVKAAAISRSSQAFVLADSEKFNLVTSVTFAPLVAATIITDSLKDIKYKKITRIKEVMK